MGHPKRKQKKVTAKKAKKGISLQTGLDAAAAGMGVRPNATGNECRAVCHLSTIVWSQRCQYRYTHRYHRDPISIVCGQRETRKGGKKTGKKGSRKHTHPHILHTVPGG